MYLDWSRNAADGTVSIYKKIKIQTRTQMVKHIILWTLKEMNDSEKESVKAGIKEGLEGLKGKIPGLVDIKVNTSGRLASSTADLR